MTEDKKVPPEGVETRSATDWIIAGSAAVAAGAQLYGVVKPQGQQPPPPQPPEPAPSAPPPPPE